MHKIFVRLPMDRDYAGLLEVQTPGGTRIAGPYEVCGRADDQIARDNRNPERDPLLPFGDIPYGEYWVAGIVASGAGTKYGSEEYGSAGVVVLEPRNGDAALADANGRFRFLIHGGKSAAGGGLRPTDGSLRLSNRDQQDLVGVLRRLQGSSGTCLVVQAEHLRTRLVVASHAADEPRYAQIVSALTLSAISRRSRMLATFWLRAMMGATGALVAVRSALGFSLGSTPSDPSGNLRAALQAKGSSSGLSGKPHFTAGRLYAQRGGDYSQPAPEEQAPAPQQQTPTAPQEQTPAPQQTQPEEEAPTPQPEEETPTPEPQEETPAPEPQEETPAPEPQEETPAPEPQEETPAPAPQEETPAPEPQEETPAPAPQQETPAPEPQEETPAPAPQEETPAPQPQEEAPAPQPQEETPAPTPQEEAPAPAPQEAAPAEEQPGTNTNAMDQLKNAQQESQQAAKNPNLEEAHEQASQPFDKGGKPVTPTEPTPPEPPTPEAAPVVPLTPFPAGAPKETPAPTEQEPTEQQTAPQEQAPQEQAPAPQEEEQTPEEETPQEQEQTPAPQEEEETPAPQEQQEEETPTPVPQRQAPAPRPAPAAPTPRPTPAAPAPAPSEATPIIAGMTALAIQLGWTETQREQLSAGLNALDFRRSGASSTVIADTWRTVIVRGQDPELAKEAAAGQGLGFPGAGKQTQYQDCTIFALANATGLPYGVVAARATKLISEGSWRSAADRANPEAVIENQGLNGGEVVMLGAAFGQVKVIEGPEFADSLKQGHPVMLDVMPYNGVERRGAGHEVVLTRTFQHNGETWYAMMDSNYGPYTRFFLSAKELDILRQENGVSYSPNPGTTPSLLR